MKFKYLILVVVLLGASAYLHKVDVSDVTIPERKVANLGWPLPWLEATTDTVNGTATYNVLWVGLVIDIAVYMAVLLLIFG